MKEVELKSTRNSLRTNNQHLTSPYSGCLSLSVTRSFQLPCILGARDSVGMTSGLWGYIPVFLKPAIICLGVIEEFEAGTKTSQKSTLLSTQPLWLVLYFIRLDSHDLLNCTNGTESRA